MSPPIRRRLCETDAERAFVEALVVMATYKLRAEPGLLVRFTNAQVVEIVSDRHPDIDLSHVQTFERLKCRYVARPGKPATRLELLDEVAKGDRKPGQVAGVPSSYRPTGIMGFLDA